MKLLFFWGVLKKDLNLFFSGSSTIIISIIFSLSLFTLFRFASQDKLISQSMVLWITHLLSIVFLLMRSQEWESEEKAYRIFTLSNLDFEIIFVGKAIALTTVIFFLWVIEVAVWLFFFDIQSIIPDTTLFIYTIILTGFLSSLALAASGIQASALAVHSNFSVVILFMFFLPLNLPISIASSQLVMLSTQKTSNIDFYQLLYIILSFTMFYIGSGILLFEKLLEE